MKRLLHFLCFCLVACSVRAQVKTEADVVETVIRSLQNKDSWAYIDLFPGIDSMSSWILKYADKSSEPYKRMLYMQDNYYAKLDFDSSIHDEANKQFEYFQKKGTALGIHWDQIVFVRYELEKIRRGRDLISEKIAPLRFLGYVFFKDMLTRKTYALTIFDMMQVNDMWYGGELANVFEASTKDEFEHALAEERKKERMRAQGIIDTTESNKPITFDEVDDDKPSSMKEVMDRKFYKGEFDDEISVQLYVRHIKGNCPDIICSWEALFKFGDQDEFVKMSVSRTPDGKWLFTEELGGMELELKGNMYIGSYASSSDKTEYEVKLVETPIPLKKVQALDEMLEMGAHGK